MITKKMKATGGVKKMMQETKVKERGSKNNGTKNNRPAL